MRIHNLSRKPSDHIAKQSIRGVWNNIAKEIKDIKDVNTECHSLFSPIPNSNTKILFWLDLWCGSNIFRNKFPLLYELESVKRCYVTERVTNESFTWKWKSLPHGDDVISEFIELCSIPNYIRISPVPMGLKFKLNSDCIYIVNKMKMCIDSTGTHYNGLVIEWSKIIPLKVRCFIWSALQRRLHVATELIKRGVTTISDLCVICGDEQETVDHLFIKCKVVDETRDWIFKWCELPKQQFLNMEDFLNFGASWGNCPKKKANYHNKLL